MVVVGKEDGLAVVPALDHVQRLIGQNVTAKPRHRSLSSVFETDLNGDRAQHR
jgi:hypothetical protein